jgi:crossover junction endodeoxyribonuclease RusA
MADAEDRCDSVSAGGLAADLGFLQATDAVDRLLARVHREDRQGIERQPARAAGLDRSPRSEHRRNDNQGAGGEQVKLTLPYPPTVNHYWQRRGSRTFVGPDGVQFRNNVCGAVLEAGCRETMTGPLSIWIVAHPPDKRRRDIDNLTKALLDALQHAGAYGDDNQIARMLIERGSMVDGGCVDVVIDKLTGAKA